MADPGGVHATVPIDGAVAGVPGRTLYLCGQCPPAPRVAVVGARAALRGLREAVPRVVAAASRAGWSVVSGGALGVDGDAHRSCLAGRVPQLAVLPCGSDRPYPPGHRDLFDRMARVPEAGILFAVAPGTEPTRSMFASRNRLVVGLCEALVVIQAGVPSGTLGTGKLALSRGVRVAAVTGSAGAAVLVASGAASLGGPGPGVEERTLDWLQGRAPEGVGPVWPPELEPLRQALVLAGARGVTPDDLPEPLLALSQITEAEALGLVVAVAPGRYVAA